MHHPCLQVHAQTHTHTAIPSHTQKMHNVAMEEEHKAPEPCAETNMSRICNRNEAKTIVRTKKKGNKHKNKLHSRSIERKTWLKRAVIDGGGTKATKARCGWRKRIIRMHTRAYPHTVPMVHKNATKTHYYHCQLQQHRTLAQALCMCVCMCIFSLQIIIIIIFDARTTAERSRSWRWW